MAARSSLPTAATADIWGDRSRGMGELGVRSIIIRFVNDDKIRRMSIIIMLNFEPLVVD